MSTKEKWLWTYRVVRSVLFTAILFVVVLYVGLYVTLSVPSVQRKVRDVARDELSKLIGSRVEIGDVDIYPFNEVVVHDVDLYQPDSSGKRCLHVEKLGAGISLWNLVANRRIIITYAELIGMQADIWQSHENGPLNIQFLIDAFAPKDKNKPPARFDLQIRNIVIRKSAASFNRLWAPRAGEDRIDFNHIAVTGLNADVALPRLSNDRIEVDLRRLALRVNSLLEIKRLSLLAVIDHGDIALKDFSLSLPNSTITLNDQYLPLSRFGGNFGRMLSETQFDVEIKGDRIVPSEFSGFMPRLAGMQSPFTLTLSATGNGELITLNELLLSNPYDDFSLTVRDASAVKGEKGFSDIDLPEFNLHAGSSFMAELLAALQLPAESKPAAMLRGAGGIDLRLEGRGSLERRAGEAKISLISGYGPLDIEGKVIGRGDLLDIDAGVVSDGVAVGQLLADSRFGNVAFDLKGNVSMDLRRLKGGVVGIHGSDTGVGVIDHINGMLPKGTLELNLSLAEINGYPLHDFNISIDKTLQKTAILADCPDENFDFSINGELTPAGRGTSLTLNADLLRCHPGAIFPFGKFSDCTLSSELSLDLTGNNADNLMGLISLDRLKIEPGAGKNPLELNHLGLFAQTDAESAARSYILDSDWISGNIAGDFTPSRLPLIIKDLTSGLLPASMAPRQAERVVAHSDHRVSRRQTVAVETPRKGEYLEYAFRINRGGSWAEFLNLPVKLLYEADLKGEIKEDERLISLDLNAPYIQQGRDKLIQQTRLNAEVRDGHADLGFFSSIPTKKGILDLNADVAAHEGVFDIALGFNRESKGGFYGDLNLQAIVSQALNGEGSTVTAHILPGMLYLNKAGWSVGESTIVYADKQIDVTGFSIAHADQYVTIGGTASADPEQEIVVKLKDIDLDYIFDTLNINYVAFGGRASGEAVGRGLLSKNPEAFTRRLDVKDLSYNHSVLGDGKLRGDFDAATKRVGIYADVSEDGRRVALIDGGIWIGRDSLSFGVDADKVRIGFLQPFMSAFSSKVEGRASGRAQLYGTFSDIDMTGRLFADTIRLKVDYTNVTYCGSDSVIIDPGHITIPSFRLHDDYGHSAFLSGTLNHRYFHDPDFRFTISRARNLLVYDTDASMNQIWYGRIFGTGGGQIIGRPGYVGIMADMTTNGGSNFTFVLSDSQEALDYKFLTFTDKRKAAKEAERETRPDEPDEIVAAFRKKVAQQESGESVFDMDIRATITPQAQLTLVMDPVAGDRIRARGEGALNMTYSTESNDIRMYGKYTLQEGTYNFSLQDLILKDFIIKPGSSISFNGDPLNGMLDIRAAYRVNTNLTDLDKSFASDHDLNRTNVPVDAMLLVNGEMTQPDITFDIELPTLNDEVAQKVRSIISSEDMMNRQIIYLLALNRFYTPEYMGGTTSGGEWASVASSTLSSQLSNMLGQLTDKVNISPSLRSDKGDFSDLEVDLALSSRLFNNRLLINGNFGYRDRTSSSTTFIGDFDIEYLLNRSGNFRLKAYNHFNDQNYYLKSALTTQGLGVIWRKDFDRLFRRKKRKPESLPAATDGNRPTVESPVDKGQADPQPTDTIPHSVKE